MKVFTTDEVCIPLQHYMVDISGKLKEIKKLVDEGKYFTINRGEKYGKSTVLNALKTSLAYEYYVIMLDFVEFREEMFKTEDAFCRDLLKEGCAQLSEQIEKNNVEFVEAVNRIKEITEDAGRAIGLFSVFYELAYVFDKSDRPVVLIIDDVDRPANKEVLCEFLEQLRARYITRGVNDMPAFHSVILSSEKDVRALQGKEIPEDKYVEHIPWDISSDFDLDLSLPCEGIKAMLDDYESEHNCGMNTEEMAKLICEYTKGYPGLVSKICYIIDTKISKEKGLSDAWTKSGFEEAVKEIS